MDPQLVLTEPSAQQNLLPSSEMKGHKHSLDHLILWALKEMARNTWTHCISHTVNRWQRCALRDHVRDQDWSWTEQSKNLIEGTWNPQLLHSGDCQYQTALQMNGKQVQIVPCQGKCQFSLTSQLFHVSQGFQSLAFQLELSCFLQLYAKNVSTLGFYVLILGLWCYTKSVWYRFTFQILKTSYKTCP